MTRAPVKKPPKSPKAPKPPRATGPAKPPRKGGLRHWHFSPVYLLVVLGLLFALVRLGPLTPMGRSFIEHRVSGLKIGPLGHLKIEGLDGDIWSDFSLRHLTISDARGVWLDA